MRSQSSIEQDYQSKTVKKNQLLGCVIKASISGLNFSTGSAKKTEIYDLFFLNVILLKMAINIHLK